MALQPATGYRAPTGTGNRTRDRRAADTTNAVGRNRRRLRSPRARSTRSPSVIYAVPERYLRGPRAISMRSPSDIYAVPERYLCGPRAISTRSPSDIYAVPERNLHSPRARSERCICKRTCSPVTNGCRSGPGDNRRDWPNSVGGELRESPIDQAESERWLSGEMSPS